eukprot:comp18040_c0_seq3/m.18581 comp18040_c0_seq3/g.18581  ORF comp18040_c0_seq3/g.18581 comp18040_c0_seq3/m.18581 type:complete len:121 (-) comp18040_c0_seq3:70-432(-)
MHISIYGSETAHDARGRPYTLYIIKVRGSKNTVKKRFSEFEALANECKKIKTPGFSIPELPPKKWSGNMDPSFVFNRGLDLEEWLRQFELTAKQYEQTNRGSLVERTMLHRWLDIDQTSP